MLLPDSPPELVDPFLRELELLPAPDPLDPASACEDEEHVQAPSSVPSALHSCSPGHAFGPAQGSDAPGMHASLFDFELEQLVAARAAATTSPAPSVHFM
jgi:hypothetical protein